MLQPVSVETLLELERL